ncbi:MAG: 2-hydroxyacid dehydrogenase [Eubacteriaceae bacterium]|jgi:D-lactate dehydrogenase
MIMKIAFYDTRPYDMLWFDPLLKEEDIEPQYIENRLSCETVGYAHEADAICMFVNDTANKEVVDKLAEMGIHLILLRCAGFNNVDLKECAKKDIVVMRVPAYSPSSVAEYAAALLLSVNRKIPKAYMRTRDFNFNIDGLIGWDMEGKTAGIIGTGKIGQKAIGILRGFGMNVIAYDPYPNDSLDVEYVDLPEMYARADVISLHCPLTPQTKYVIDRGAIKRMKKNVVIINTSRGELIETQALIDGINDGIIGGVGLDVYEGEKDYFYENWSDKIMKDRDLARLLTFPNVIVTSHMAYLTSDALKQIAEVTIENAKAYEKGVLEGPNIVKEA